MTWPTLGVEEQIRQEHAWLAAHVYNLHNPSKPSATPGCGCEFCEAYRVLHDEPDPWVGPWSTLALVMR